MGLRRDLLLFPQGRKKALTFSYDDAVTQDVRLVEMMNRRGIRGTFNINTGLLGTESIHVQNEKTVTHNKLSREDVTTVYRGHEIAVHGLTHLDLALAGPAAASYEIAADRKNIEDLVRAPVRGMAYPFGTYTAELVGLLEHSGIAYARTINSTGSFGLPQDFLAWHPTCHHSDGRLFELAEAFFAPERKYYGPRLFYVWGHSYEFDVRDDWERMEQFLDLMSGREDVWYATNIQICDYVNDAKRLRYSCSGEYISNPSAQDIWLSVDGSAVCIRSGETKQIEM